MGNKQQWSNYIYVKSVWFNIPVILIGENKTNSILLNSDII